ncbi:metal-sensitive transcriptional regulator [Nocardioides pakistanensis]
MTTTPGYITDKQALLIRLRRIEGQVRGLQRQVENETYCVEILTQVAAATKALESVALMLLDQHLQHCLTHAADPTERDQKLTEASRAIARLVHS